jgi:DNA-directed RNA polymerase specialized sigma24 family protein
MTNNENHDEVIEETNEEQEEQQEELTELQKAQHDAEKWKTRFKGLAKKTNDSETDDRDVDSIVEEKLQQREVLSKMEHVIDQIPEQYREAFQAEFDELK